ncbi:hypothetical protein HK101_001002 [Irineochytrium annulatum]|nr:hypothetical protein HK101_001002 [Irineochytrium annulatum]
MAQQRTKVLITGGAGFVGSQLGYKLVNDGYDVILLDNMQFGHLDNLVIEGKLFGTFVCKDIRDEDLQKYFKDVDTVFHLAGVAALPVCQSKPQFAYDVNVSGTANVLEYARRANVRRVIFSSTSAVYEMTKSEIQKEDEQADPNLIYSMTKHAAEDVCRAYSKNYGVDIIVARFFNVYGPHQDFKRTSPPFTSYISRELAAGRQPTLFNKSDAKRDYIHVDDVIALLVAMMKNDSHFSSEVFNIGSGKSYSTPDLYERMRVISGKEIEPRFDDPEKFWNSYGELFESKHPLDKQRIKKEVYKNNLADNSKARQTFKWEPKVDIDAGFRGVYEYASQRMSEA